jgi:site-specific recombinase XerD
VAIGRPDLRIHDLRHTFGTWLAQRGQNLMVIKDMLGHADIRTTQRYVHPDTDSMIRAAEVIDFPIDDGAPRQTH